MPAGARPAMNRRSFLGGIRLAGLAFLPPRVLLPPFSSGKNFAVTYEDIAPRAGLGAPTIYGGRGEWKYILETTGCGAAFYDFDNDGWLDIFLVNGQALQPNP